MFLMNSSQRENKADKAYNHKIIKDLLKMSLIVVGLKVATALINKNWYPSTNTQFQMIVYRLIIIANDSALVFN